MKPPIWEVNEKGIFPDALGAKAHTGFAEVLCGTVVIRSDCEFPRVSFFAETARFGTDVNECVGKGLTSVEISDNEIHFKVSVAHPFHGLTHRGEGENANDEERYTTKRKRFICRTIAHSDGFPLTNNLRCQLNVSGMPAILPRMKTPATRYSEAQHPSPTFGRLCDAVK
jgi:hypothetical protein